MKNRGNSSSYYRLIALWAICEAMIGGIIHGLHIPVSGLIVGSCAVICISLIAWYHPQKGAILKATLIVAIFKMMLSPQAPVTAYVAVFFQGALGELLFWRRRYFGFACFVLALLSLLESGLQRILMLTIIYGNDLWFAINDLLNKLTGQKQWTNYSRWLIGIYVGVHFLAGLLVGWLCAVLPSKIEKWRVGFSLPPVEMVDAPQSAKRKKRKWSMLVIWSVLLLLYIQSNFHIGTPILPENIILKILLRSFLIVAAWIFIVGPLLRMALHAWLRKKQAGASAEVAKVLELIPSTQQVIKASWAQAGTNKNWKKYKDAFKYILVNALSIPENNLYILSAPIGSGKTSSLLQWLGAHKEASGILSPVREGKRFFLDIRRDEYFPMEASEGESDILKIGRFDFSGAAFARAIQALNEEIHSAGWLIIDEIGPLELKGQGFAEILRLIIKQRKGKTLLVVRENLVEEVLRSFNLQAIVVKEAAALPD